jgi:hypothetical protein
MSSRTTRSILPLVILLAVTLLTGNALASVQGAVWTTDMSGTIVNQNIYVYHQDVYFNGGPQNGNHSGLPDGLYWFQVTDPSGGVLLSTDNAVCRQIVVTNGVVSGSTGPPSCKHPIGAYNPANGSTTVQLAPFATTPNNGNEYKAWLVAQSGASISTTDPRVLNFKRNDSKTDNFKVQNAPPPPPPTLSPTACNPTSALSVLLAQSGVVAYIPNGNWGGGPTGVQVVPIEPAGTPSSIATRDVVNSCASNSVSGQTVCTANGSDVYLITGSALNATLSSASNATTSFSGGNCKNCGVAIESNSNTAVIAMGYSASASGTALQFLHLGANAFDAPFPTVNAVSEDVLWDPVGNRILSPNENGGYDLLELETGLTKEYGRSIGGTLDSAAEDCLTGIALSTDEYTSNLVLTDLTQATYSLGPPATWSAPLQFQYIPEWDPYDGSESGTDGIAVATGTHYGIVTGEYPFPPAAANAIMAILLPSTSGSGTPALQDYAVATMPNDPMGYTFSVGCDPHTVTAYLSPTTGKATGVLEDYGPITCYNGGTPQYVATVDLQGLLAAPRIGTTHNVDPSYDLLGQGIVTFVATH